MKLLKTAFVLPLLLFALSASSTHVFPMGGDRSRVENDSCKVDRLSSVSVLGRLTNRVQICYPSGNCVVLVDKAKVLTSTMDDEQKMLNSESLKASEQGHVVNDLAYCDEKDRCAINCHGYACLVNNIPCLPHSSWVEGMASPLTNGTNPLKVILNEHFNLIKTYDDFEERSVTNDGSLKEGDFITFLDKQENNIHSGVLVERMVEGKTMKWVRAKISEGEIIETPIQNVGLVYPHVGVQIFRRKTMSSSSRSTQAFNEEFFLTY